MELFIYKGLHPLPSIDFDCLRTLAYVKLCGASVKINTNSSPYKSPTGCLPYLCATSNSGGNNECPIYIAGYANIVEHLNKLGFKCVSQEDDDHLSTAYISYLQEKIYPALQYFLWGDPQTVDNIRMAYARRIRFPFNFYYPPKQSKKVDLLMQLLENFSTEEKIEFHQIDALVKNAKICLNLISERVGNNKDYFFDNGYSELDATIYAYLGVIIYILPQTNPLRSHVNECPNLQNFFIKFQRNYFLETISTTLVSERDKEELIKLSGSSQVIDIEEKSYSQLLPKILSVLFAVGTMTIFAVKHGIFTRFATNINNEYGNYESYSHDENDDDDNEDDS